MIIAIYSVDENNKYKMGTSIDTNAHKLIMKNFKIDKSKQILNTFRL